MTAPPMIKTIPDEPPPDPSMEPTTQLTTVTIIPTQKIKRPRRRATKRISSFTTPCLALFRHDQINLKSNQVRRELWQTVTFPLCKSVFDGDILSLSPSELAHLLSERLQEGHATRSSAIIQVTDAGDFSWLLRLGGNANRKQHRCNQN
jgi:hypothetical protein